MAPRRPPPDESVLPKRRKPDIFLKARAKDTSACQAPLESAADAMPAAASGSSHEIATDISTAASDELAKHQKEYRQKLKEMFVTSKMSAKETVQLAQVSQKNRSNRSRGCCICV